jgi:hypothetical protein
MANINTNKNMEYFYINFEVSVPVRDWQQETEQVHTFLRTLITPTLTEQITFLT